MTLLCISLAFQQTLGRLIEAADSNTQSDRLLRLKPPCHLTRAIFHQPDQQRTDATTAIVGMHINRKSQLSLFTLPHLAVANDLPGTCDNDPGIRFQIEARSLPVFLYVLLHWICDPKFGGIALDH